MTIVVVKDIRKVEVSVPLRNGKIIKFAIVKKMGKAFNAFPFFYWPNITNFFIVILINYDKIENRKGC
jgi:hypothetical protein